RTGHFPAAFGRNTSARTTRPSSMTIPTSHSMNISSCSTASAIFSDPFLFASHHDCLICHSIYQTKNSNKLGARYMAARRLGRRIAARSADRQLCVSLRSVRPSFLWRLDDGANPRPLQYRGDDWRYCASRLSRVATLRCALLTELGAAIQHRGEGVEDLAHLRRLVGKQLG